MERSTLPNTAPLASFDLPAPAGRPPRGAEAEAPQATPRWWEYAPRHAEVMMELRAEQASTPTCPRKGLSCDAEGETPRTREASMLRPMRHPDEASWFPERIILVFNPAQRRRGSDQTVTYFPRGFVSAARWGGAGTIVSQFEFCECVLHLHNIFRVWLFACL